MTIRRSSSRQVGGISTLALVGKLRKAQQQFETPEELYGWGSLGRTEDAVRSLRGYQTHALRAYAEWQVDAPDIAPELPTGTGRMYRILNSGPSHNG